jgi:hypothetical protein
VRNPERRPEPEVEPRRGPGPAATAGECGRVAEGPEPSPVPGELAPEPAGSAAPDAAL